MGCKIKCPTCGKVNNHCGDPDCDSCTDELPVPQSEYIKPEGKGGYLPVLKTHNKVKYKFLKPKEKE